MTNVREKKRKLILVSVTFVLCITIMLTGTFAWSSLGQSVINETMGEMTNPGGRLHDDFNGSNKDIYVENFTAGTDGMDIIVRIRLSEYMEIGEDAGINRELDYRDRDVDILTMHDADGDGMDDAPADINTTSTWDIVTPRNNNHYGYWSWGLGGQTVYLPTLDTDKDSNSVDRNGTYEGNDGDLTQGTPFDDYHTYVEGNVYDGRTAKTTIDGTVMDMGWWVTEGNKELGNYWVYDGDGWAYWAQPLSPQEATGLLLSQISHSRTIEDKWYYAINVECQMVTVDEIGSESNEEGFYSKEALGKPSKSARDLLDALIKEIGYVEVEAGTYGMYTADISDEELQQLLSEKEAEKEALEETEETDLEDLIEPDATEENEDEEQTDDKESSDEELNEDDTPETEGGDTPGDTTSGTESGDTPGDITSGTEGGDTPGDTTSGTEGGDTPGDTTSGTEGGDTPEDTTSGAEGGDTPVNTTPETGTSTGTDTPSPTTGASDLSNTVNDNAAETKSAN